MEKENKKKDEAIDEQYLMSMMAGGIRRDGIENNDVSDVRALKPETTAGKRRKPESRSNATDYEALFLTNAESNARNGKSVYIRPEFHERLTRIVQVIGEDKISLYAYLDNVLEYHFREFGDQIKKSFDDKYKPIF